MQRLNLPAEIPVDGTTETIDDIRLGGSNCSHLCEANIFRSGSVDYHSCSLASVPSIGRQNLAWGTNQGTLPLRLLWLRLFYQALCATFFARSAFSGWVS